MRKRSHSELETMRLNRLGRHYYSEKARTIDREQMLMISKECIEYVKGPNVLELGYTDRGWTDLLLLKGFDLTVIEGSIINYRIARNKYKDVNINHMLFEEYVPDRSFDSIVMSCVLEHVNSPVGILRKASNWLKDDGRLIIIVPNKKSLHRHIGFNLGMIQSFEELSPQDLEVGHRRLYDIESMLSDIRNAKLNGQFKKGVFLKPLSSDGLKSWDRKMLWAFNQVSYLMPEVCAYLCFVAAKSENGYD